MSPRTTIRTLSLLLALATTLFAVCLTGTAAAAETEGGAHWVQQSPATSPSARHGAATTFDQATGQIVLFGGSANGTDLGDTWTYDGTTWTKQSPAESPPARHGASMTFDQATGKVVLFGGSANGTDLGDTWTYDGTTWTKQSPSESPSARHGAAMTFDQATGQTVLFGGSAGGTDLGDTWTYAGGNWTKQNPSTSPPAREGAAMTFDLGSGHLVLFGGSGSGGPLGDTWTYDGTTWTEAKPATSPSARTEAAITFDQTIGKTILVGGNGSSGRLGDVWTYEEGSWTKAEGSPTPSPRSAASLEFDPSSGQAVLFGGSGNSGDLADTWTFGPPSGPVEPTLTWDSESPEHLPSGRQSAAMAFDPAIGKVVMFGGMGEGGYPGATWQYDGEDWSRRSPDPSPSGRSDPAMAFDPAIGEMVLFGGSGEGGLRGDTWTYDGENWTKLSPAQSPTARYGASMAYDPAIGQMILFGGRAAHEEVPNETWAFDGKNWVELHIPEGPYGRVSPGMAFDPAIGKVVMFDGGEWTSAHDTWTFGADGWTPQSYEGPELSSVAMTFDASSGRILLYGRDRPSGESQTWANDGSGWARQATVGSPEGRARGSLAFDPTTGRSVLFGGLNYYGYPTETSTLHGPASKPDPRRHPRPVIFSPVLHEYALGESVETNFACYEAEGEPGIRSCTDSGGASRPHGFLDTSTLGEHTYTVTAETQNGTLGTAEDDYVVKARPTVTVEAPASVAPGTPITASATISGGASPGGKLHFLVHGPNSPHCWSPTIFVSEEEDVTGNGTYEMKPTYTPTTPGVYSITAHYSGDESNEETHSECTPTGDHVAVGKVVTSMSLEVSPNPDRVGGRQYLSAQVTGSEPTGTITFRDGTEVLGVERIDEYRGTASLYTSLPAGKHELTAVYSGDEVNPSSTSPVVEETIVGPTPPPSEPEEPTSPEEPVLPSEPEEPVLPVEPEEITGEKPKDTTSSDEQVVPTVSSDPTTVASPSPSVAPTVTAGTAPSPASPEAPAPIAASPGVKVHEAHASGPRQGSAYTFTFSSPVTGPRFLCSLDGSALASCHSPATFRHLSRGTHRLIVKAVGANGVESAQRTVRFFVGRSLR